MGEIAMYNHILVPVDGSKYSVRAAVRAADIAEKYQGAVTLLHVINPSQLTGLGPMQDPPLITENMVSGLNEAGWAIINEALHAIGDTSVEIATEVVWGSPDRVILAKVAEKPFDLIVMGSRGLGAISGLLLGSVSDGVVRRATCPVLIVK